MSEQISGVIKHVVLQKENGWAVVRLMADAPYNAEITVTGVFPKLKSGIPLHIEGDWVENKRWGKQFKAENFLSARPKTAYEMELYLSSNLVKGIGPATATKIVKKFGDQTFDILDNHPELLLTIEGIGKYKLKIIQESWNAQKADLDTLLYLRKIGISTQMAVKLYKEFGSKITSMIEANPYILVKKVRNFGFKKADQIAQNMGFGIDFPPRIRAGILHTLECACQEGHTAMEMGSLVGKASLLLDLPPESVAKALVDMIHKKEVIKAPAKTPDGEPVDCIYPSWLYYHEFGVAKHIHRLMSNQDTFVRSEMLYEQHLRNPSESAKKLRKTQNSAIALALKNPVTVLTGGPGTGKTSTLKALVELLNQAGVDFVLTAPTGRAAQRMAETTGFKASTIHRLLKYDPRTNVFLHDEKDPIKSNFFIIDEMSMVDAYLMDCLLRAVPDDAHVLMVGDADQLPSVSAGNVLNDIISSNIVPVTKLTEVFRQDEKSFITLNAHRINNCQMPVIPNDIQKCNDFFFFKADDPDAIANTVLELVTKKIPATFGFDPKTQIQVLAPMYRGDIGVDELNIRLQELLNPPYPSKKEHVFGKKIFRTGDKVMQLQNDYDLNIFNGDIGFIKDITDKGLVIDFTGEKVDYPFECLENLTLAYCATIHKSQGSEFDAVVMPYHESYSLMLRKNLTYTGITRAKKLVILVGTKRAVAISVSNNRVERRLTGLELFLKQVNHQPIPVKE